MSPARRAAFRATLEERISRRANSWRWPALAFVATAAALVALWLTQPEKTPPVQASNQGSELYAFIDSDTVSEELSASSSYLPDDYRALALLIEPTSASRKPNAPR
jgi:anti-sigma-K factor RskA